MKIAIRADGGAQIGMGHIMRTLVLAKEFVKTNEVIYICRIDQKDIWRNSNGNFSIENISDRYKKGIEKIISERFKVCFVRENYLIDDIGKISADILITDSYDVDENYFNETKNIFNRTVYIDDMNLYYFNVDFLLNQNADAEDFNYRVNDNTKLMLGFKYTMIRDEFRKLPPKDIKVKVCDIMLTVGGADPLHITDKILSWINGLDYNFHVVIGPSFDNSEALKRFESDKIKLYYNADMCEIMGKCDMAVSACGSTLYELAACGVPTIGVIIADNQKGIGKKLDNMKIIKNLGCYDKINKDAFVNSIVNLAEDYHKRDKMSKEASALIDGKGVKRISKMLIPHCN